MRILSWFICVIVIALSFVPCADAGAHDLTSFKTSVDKSVSHSASERERGLDSCSPFCVCTCCNTTTVAPQTFFFVSIALQTVAEYVNFPFGKATSAIISVWQPPQLG